MQIQKILRERIGKIGEWGKQKLNISDDAAGRAKRRIWIQGGLTAVALLAVIGVFFGLTAAWYNNIVKTDTIVLSAKEWTFEGQISVGTLADPNDPNSGKQAIQAAPGDSGVFPVSVTNGDPSLAINVRVDVAKTGMAEDFQKRLYAYYMDNGSKVYLNSYNHYIYRDIQPGDTLVLGGDAADPQATLGGQPADVSVIYWEWVYDMLGYIGVATYDGELSSTPDMTKFHITEYLEPIVYDLETAVFDSNGKLYKVNNENATMAFNNLLLKYTNVTPTAFYAPNGDYYNVFGTTGNGGYLFLYLPGRATIQSESSKDMQIGLTAGQDPPVYTVEERQFTFYFTGENAQP